LLTLHWLTSEPVGLTRFYCRLPPRSYRLVVPRTMSYVSSISISGSLVVR